MEETVSRPAKTGGNDSPVQETFEESWRESNFEPIVSSEDNEIFRTKAETESSEKLEEFGDVSLVEGEEPSTTGEPLPELVIDFSPDGRTDPNKPAAELTSDAIAENGSDTTTDSTDKTESFSKPFDSTDATVAEIEWMRDAASPEEIKNVKEEINEHGKNPRESILSAAENSDVIGLGEWHVNPNGLRTLTETMMPDFKEAGVTHLAVEIHKENQEVLDKAVKGDDEAAEALKRMYGGLHDDSIEMMRAADKAGIKVVAVDGQYPTPVDYGGIIAGGYDTTDPKELQDRDNEMSGNIEQLLKDNPDSKVLFVVGSKHLESHPDDYNSSAEQLRENGIKTTTFGAQMDQNIPYFTTPPLADSASHAVSVETGKTEHLKNFPATTVEGETETLGRHDHTVFFPNESALQIAEQHFGENSTKLLPHLDNLAKQEFLQDGDPEKGMQLLERALKIEEAEFGENSPQVAARHTQMADRSTGQEALEHHKKSLEIRGNLPGDQSSATVITMADIIDLNLKEGNTEEALEYFKQGQEIMNNKPVDSQAEFEWSQRAHGTARQLIESGKLEDGVGVLNSLAQRYENMGNQSSASYEYGEIAQIYANTNQPEKTEEYLRKSLSSAEKFAESHTYDDRLKRPRTELARFLESEGRADEAEPLLQQTLEQETKSRFNAIFKGAGEMQATGDLMNNMVLQDKPERVSEYYDHAMELAENGTQSDGRDHNPESLTEAYAKYMREKGNDIAAEKAEERLKQLEEKRKKEDRFFEGF